MTNFPLDLRDYLKVYNNYFDKDFCSQIVSSIDKLNWTKHQYYTPDNQYISYDDDLQISYHDIPEKNHLMMGIKGIIEKYILLDMPQEFTWFKYYNGFSEVRFNRYDKSTSMHPHCDHIHDMFDGQRKGIPILSVVGLLNDNFSGGDFIMWGDQKIELSTGSVMVFPSVFLYPHCVTPVNEGTRYSFVSWVF